MKDHLPSRQAVTAARSTWFATGLRLHQDNPYSVNVGLYYVRGRPHVAMLFQIVHRYLEAFPQTFDQAMINCVIKRVGVTKALSFLFARDNCQADNINYSHPILVRRRAHASSRPLVGGSGRVPSRLAFSLSGQRSIPTLFVLARVPPPSPRFSLSSPALTWSPPPSHLHGGGGLEVGPQPSRRPIYLPAPD